MFDEAKIAEIVQGESSRSPLGVLNELEADLANALFRYRKLMDRINRHSEVLAVFKECGYKVTDAAKELDMSREGVYKHIRKERKSTETTAGVDTKAA